MKLGIFDSGRGGELVAEKLRDLLPEHQYIAINDLAHAPYGERSYEEIQQLTERAIQPLLDCDAIIIACNTATVAAIDYLRELHPGKTIIGFEPMIKPAANTTKSNRVTLLATNATAHSPRTEELIATYAPNLIVDRPATSGWATLIDKDQADQIVLADVENSVKKGSDVIIIGCTHYIALVPRLEAMFPSITILEPTEAVARQIARITNAQPPR